MNQTVRILVWIVLHYICHSWLRGIVLFTNNIFANFYVIWSLVESCVIGNYITSFYLYSYKKQEMVILFDCMGLLPYCVGWVTTKVHLNGNLWGWLLIHCVAFCVEYKTLCSLSLSDFCFQYWGMIRALKHHLIENVLFQPPFCLSDKIIPIITD